MKRSIISIRSKVRRFNLLLVNQSFMMRKRKKISHESFIFLFFNLLLLTYSQSTVAQKDNHFRILNTTDVHGAVFPYDFISSKPSKGSLAQVYTYVEQQRQIYGNHLILLDNGDLLQGQPTVYYYNFEAKQQNHLLAEVMNYMAYDAATVGNHDIEAGHAVYDSLCKAFEFPWLAANAVDTLSNTPYFKPYTILERAGVRIAILGLITPAIPQWLPEKLWAGIRFDDMIQTAQHYVTHIQTHEKPDILIGMFHAGLDYTYNNQTANTPKNENAVRLIARQVDGFDAIIAGHDHQEIIDTEIAPGGKKVLIINANCRGQRVGVLDIKLSENGKKNITAGIVDVSPLPPHQEFMKTFSSQYDSIQAFVNQTVGELSSTLYAVDALLGNAAFTDLIHQIQFKESNAQISFTAPLSRHGSIEAGILTMRDLFKLYKFENQIYVMTLSGREIKDYLEYSAALWFNHMKSPDDHLLNISIEDGTYVKFKNPYFNYSSAAGICYTVDVSKAKGKRIDISHLSDGQPFDMNKTYRVALNSYRGSGGGGHLTQGAGIPQEELAKRLLWCSDRDLRYYLMQYIKHAKRIDPQAYNNWQILPADWYKAARERDRKLLMGGE